VGLLLAVAGSAQAGKVASIRTDGQRSHGVRPDKSVPYLTNGDSGFFSGSVGPKVYKSPIVDDPKNPGARPVFNIIFYGGVQGFGDAFNGAVPRQTKITPR
jgi:hypothetical protein